MPVNSLDDFLDGPSSASVSTGTSEPVGRMADASPPAKTSESPAIDPAAKAKIERAAVRRHQARLNNNGVHTGEEPADDLDEPRATETDLYDGDEDADAPTETTGKSPADKGKPKAAEGDDSEAQDDAKQDDAKQDAAHATLAARAKAAGLSDEQIKVFAEDNILERIVATREAAKAATTPADKTATADKPTEKAANKAADRDELTELEEQGFDPTLVKTLREGIVKPLREKLDRVTAYVQQLENERMAADFERAFAADEFQEILGTGDTDAISPESPEYMARHAIAAEVVKRINLYQGSGEQPPPVRELVPRVAREMFHTRLSRLQEKALIEKVQNTRTRRTTTPPVTRSRPAEPTGVEKAINTANRLLAKLSV